ncbi:MAG: DNA ligase [Aquificaceae bacterium]|nr:MAG: DNA ligase [Aquificaceae bacterium]
MIKSRFLVFSLILSLFLLPSLLLAKPSKPDLLLAKVYRDNIDISQYWVSEKYDGVRAYWNGKQLISRQGHPYYAPKWFTADFPNVALDGELWIARNRFEKLISTVRKKSPIDDEWRQVRYMVFELPQGEGTFSTRLSRLKNLFLSLKSPYIKLIKQYRVKSHALLMKDLDDIIKKDAEGLMLHRADALYHTGRRDDLLKVKRYQDAEARVIKHLQGKGKYHDVLGALLVETAEGKRFKIGSGFSDEERKHPPAIGALVTYKFFGKTVNGIPRFASFLRVRNVM